MIEAACEGHLSCLDVLLSHGCELNATDTNGRTALMEAVFKRRVCCVKSLLKRGADVNAADNKGQTAVIEAASQL